MSPDGIALRHSALVYDADDEYVARAVPFLMEGLEAGEGPSSHTPSTVWR